MLERCIMVWSGVRLWTTMSVVTAFCAVTVGVGPAQAQATNPPTLEKPDLNPQTNPDPALPSTGESLSERLQRSGGVIAPSKVDPEMTVPPKDPSAGSSMPVIPPPGSPGGDRSISPK